VTGTNVQVCLTRRNLEALLVKLDREGSHCTIVKNDTVHEKYPVRGADRILVTAVENEDYYNRPAGVMFEELL
jgi:hypothetical protein